MSVRPLLIRFPLRLAPVSAGRDLLLVGLLAALLPGCQKSDSHPPFIGACDSDCSHLPGVVVNAGSGGSAALPVSDAGPTSLSGQVLLLSDDSFARATLFTARATVSADGANGSPVTADWDGVDPYELDGVAPAETSWIGVKPDLVGGDALLTYQAVRTNSVQKVDLAVVSSAVLDGIFNAVSAIRDPNSATLVLFLHSAGTGKPLAGLHVTATRASTVAYKAGNTWSLDAGNAVTDSSGLVLLGNVDVKASAIQTVTVTRAATASSPAVDGGQFALKAVQGSASIATASVEL